MKNLKQVTVIGLGLLGGSITLAAKSRLNGVKITGYSHRSSTRNKARKKALADKVFDDINESVKNADLIILATPIFTFERIFKTISSSLKKGAIVTDVGSTKTLPKKWAKKALGKKGVTYIGSHPIAGSEQRGLEFARDDLLENALCIITGAKSQKKQQKILEDFWSALGCNIYRMTPAQHDKIFANVSHLPHIVAAALVNSTNSSNLKWAGKGFIDTSRIASGPGNIWSDILSANRSNALENIRKVKKQLDILEKGLQVDDKNKIEKFLDKARSRRNKIIEDKIKSKEILQ